MFALVISRTKVGHVGSNVRITVMKAQDHHGPLVSLSCGDLHCTYLKNDIFQGKLIEVLFCCIEKVVEQLLI